MTTSRGPSEGDARPSPRRGRADPTEARGRQDELDDALVVEFDVEDVLVDVIVIEFDLDNVLVNGKIAIEPCARRRSTFIRLLGHLNQNVTIGVVTPRHDAAAVNSGHGAAKPPIGATLTS